MDEEEQDLRLTWSQSVQARTPGEALDIAIAMLREQLLSDRKTSSRYTAREMQPDQSVVTGPFSPYMRKEAPNKYNNVDGVWDITIRWY